MTHKDNRTHLAVRGRNGQTYFAGQQNGDSGAYFDGEATVRKGLKDYYEIYVYRLPSVVLTLMR